MIAVHFRAACKTTMHKRKCDNLFDLRQAEISVTVSNDQPGSDRLRANCWVEDEEGRKQGIVLTHDFIMGIVESVERLKKSGEIIPEGNAKFS